MTHQELANQMRPRGKDKVKATASRENERTAAYPSHAGDADVVSTGCGVGGGVAFVEFPKLVEGAPLMHGRYAASRHATSRRCSYE